MSTPQRIHVLFLDARAGLGADMAVHLSLAGALDRRVVRVSAATSPGVTPESSACDAFEKLADTTFKLNLGERIGPKRGLTRTVALLQNLRGAMSLIRLARWCRRNRVDIIHVTERPRQALFGMLLAKLSRCALVIHAHTSFYAHDATRFATWRLQQADAVIGVSNFTAQTYRTFGTVPSDRTFAVHNAVDTERFRPDGAAERGLAMRGQLGIPAGVPVIGCVARLMRWKGQGTLLEAFAIVRKHEPTARLVLAGLSADSAPDGRGTYQDFLVRRAADLGLSDAVLFPGFLPQTAMPDFHAALDVLAHPSVEEPFGLAVVEAMATARPVVASNGGGIPEIIRDGVDGLLVAPEQPEQLADALLRVLRDRRLAADLGQSARARVLDQFTPDKQAATMANVYRRVVARRARRAPVAAAGARVRGRSTVEAHAND